MNDVDGTIELAKAIFIAWQNYILSGIAIIGAVCFLSVLILLNFHSKKKRWAVKTRTFFKWVVCGLLFAYLLFLLSASIFDVDLSLKLVPWVTSAGFCFISAISGIALLFGTFLDRYIQHLVIWLRISALFFASTFYLVIASVQLAQC